MLQANELRIGSWVWLEKNGKRKYYQISSGHDIDEIDGYGVDIFPIVISPEILEKCGFKETFFKGFYKLDNGKFSPWLKKCDGYWEITVGDPEYSIGEITNLHQLQNIHFSLTGEELTVNL